jgi:hypothetical protein
MTRQHVETQIQNMSKLYLNDKISLQDVFDVKFHFPENGISMTAGIAGFVENKPVVVICDEIEFDSFVKEVRNQIYKKSILSKVFNFLADVFG